LKATALIESIYHCTDLRTVILDTTSILIAIAIGLAGLLLTDTLCTVGIDTLTPLEAIRVETAHIRFVRDSALIIYTVFIETTIAVTSTLFLLTYTSRAIYIYAVITRFTIRILTADVQSIHIHTDPFLAPSIERTSTIILTTIRRDTDIILTKILFRAIRILCTGVLWDTFIIFALVSRLAI